MLEPMDVYRLARHLRDRGEPVSGTEDVLARYAHASWLTDRFPVFLVNTGEPLDSCVFLNDGQCSVYEARPRVCRMYPFIAAPGERGRDFLYHLCLEKPHHFADGVVKPKDWLAENFAREARDALKADYDALPAISRNIRAMNAEEFQRGIEDFQYISHYSFPKDIVQPSDRVVLYGAGEIGKSYFIQNLVYRYCDIILWVDRNYLELGNLVQAPQEVCRHDCAKIIIAIESFPIYQKIREQLINLGISHEKIIWPFTR